MNGPEIISELTRTLQQAQKGIKDTAVSVIPQGVALVSGLTVSVLLARGLGPMELGKYTLVISVPAMMTALSDLGIGQTAIRYGSRCLANGDKTGHLAVLRWAFRIRVLVVLALALIAFLTTPYLAGEFWHIAGLSPLVRFSLSIAIFSAVASVPPMVFQSVKRFRANAGILVLQALPLMVGMIVLETMDAWSLSGVVVVAISASAFNAIIAPFIVPRAAIFKWSDFGLAKNGIENYLKAPKFKDYSADADSDSTATVFAFFMMLSAGVVMLVGRADVWLMGYFLESGQIGIYSVSSRVALPLMIFVTAVNMVLWPRTANLKKEPDPRKFVRGVFILSGVAALFGLVYSIIAPLFIPIAFGQAYSDGILVGQLLCVRFCLTILLSPVGIIGYNYGFVRFIWLINIVQLFAVVGINVWLLPEIGPAGSALALIAVELIGGIFTVPILWHRMKKKDSSE